MLYYCRGDGKFVGMRRCGGDEVLEDGILQKGLLLVKNETIASRERNFASVHRIDIR